MVRDRIMTNCLRLELNSPGIFDELQLSTAVGQKWISVFALVYPKLANLNPFLVPVFKVGAGIAPLLSFLKEGKWDRQLKK